MAYSPNVDYRAEARKAAQRHGLSPSIFERQIGVESVNYDPAVISGRRSSPAGAQGIAQIMPGTAKAWGVDPLHPIKALDAAAEKMAGYVRKYGSYDKALRAYNAGEGGIQASYGYAEMNRYVKEILHGHDPGRLSAPESGPGGGSAGSGGGGRQTAAQGAQGTNLGQGSSLTASLAAALQASGGQGKPSVAVSAPALPAFAAQPKLAGPAAPSVDPQVSGGTDLKGLLSTVLASGDQTQQPGVPGQAGSSQPPAGGGAPHGVGRTLVVGDSLGVGTFPQLQKLLGGRVTGDVKVGRASPEGVKVLARKLKGGDYQNIVFDQGTNDVSATELRKSLAQVRRLAPHARILIPTLNGPFATPAKNAVLHAFAQGDPNVKLVPWHSLSQNGLLGPDSTHATPAGYSKRAQLIARELGWVPARAGGSAPATVSPHGKWGGTSGPAFALFERFGKPLGLSVTSTKRHNTNPYSGTGSDHDVSQRQSFAIDASNGSAPTPQMDQYAYDVMHALGFKSYRKGTPINTSQGVTTINGLRYQVIYRGSGEAFGGNHLTHVHVGIRRVR